MRIHSGASVWRVLLLFSLVFLPYPARADLAPAGVEPLFTGAAGSGGTGQEYCLDGTIRAEETCFFSPPVARVYLAAVTSGFRKTKVHARRLSAQCRFSGTARVAGICRFEGGAAVALLPLAEGPRREKTPQGTRSPPSML